MHPAVHEDAHPTVCLRKLVLDLFSESHAVSNVTRVGPQSVRCTRPAAILRMSPGQVVVARWPSNCSLLLFRRAACLPISLPSVPLTETGSALNSRRLDEGRS